MTGRRLGVKGMSLEAAVGVAVTLAVLYAVTSSMEQKAEKPKKLKKARK